MTPVLVSAVSEALAVRVSKKATYLMREFEQSQSRLDKLYKRFPVEVSELRERLVPFFSDLSENPSSLDFVGYLHELRDHIITFYDSYTWWLQQVKNITGNLSSTT